VRLRVREDAAPPKALGLPGAGRQHPGAYLGGALALRRGAAGEFLEADGGHVDVYVDAVEQRAGDAR
jgi:hypothetical protein